MSERDSQRADKQGSPSTASDVDAPELSQAVDVVPPESVLDVTSDGRPAIELDLRSPGGRKPAGDTLPDQVADNLRRVRLFGLDFVDAPDLGPVIDALVARDRPSQSHQVSTVLTPNVDIMVQLDKDCGRSGRIWDMFQRSQFCLPDGQPIVAASHLLGRPLSARLTGSGLFARIWPRLVAEERSVFVVASSEEVANLLRMEHPGATAAVAPMFKADDSETIDRIAESVVASATADGPEFVFLGIGHPKDALLADAVLRRWPTDLGRPPTLLGLGGSAAMHVGITKRAPEWVQRIGMEWFYRFIQEPRRLFHRYFVRDTAFFGLVWRERRALLRE